MNQARATPLSKSLAAVVMVLAGAFALSGCAPQRVQPRTIPVAKYAASHDPSQTVTAQPGPQPGLPIGPDAEPVASPEDQPTEDLTAVDDAAEAGPAEGPLTESPLDELADVEAHVDTGELAKSRDLLTEGPTFDIPVPVNDQVLTWVELYTHRFKGAFEAGLARSGRYMERFREIFAEEGVPQDLVYMAAVESGYKTTAYSRAHARGIFQFIAPTARLYGLRVDSWVDERADPEKSCRAAAQYMKKLYGDFGDWHLALAAYNAGEGKVEQAIRRAGSNDFWTIALTPHLKLETRNHVPAVLAAALLSKSPEKYGLSYEPEAPLRYDTVTVQDSIDLRVMARCSGVSYETFRQLNPALRRDHTPSNTKVQVRVPQGKAETTLAALAAVPRERRVADGRYRVSSGDTLSSIADRLGVSVRALQAANGLGNRTLIQKGQSLRIPGAGGGTAGTATTVAQRKPETPSAKQGVKAAASGGRSVASARRSAGGASQKRGESTDGAEARIHTVRPGETLWAIASRYRTSVNTLCSINSISPTGVLQPGSSLTVGFE